jgi:hypothetical protein
MINNVGMETLIKLGSGAGGGGGGGGGGGAAAAAGGDAGAGATEEKKAMAAMAAAGGWIMMDYCVVQLRPLTWIACFFALRVFETWQGEISCKWAWASIGQCQTCGVLTCRQHSPARMGRFLIESTVEDQ